MRPANTGFTLIEVLIYSALFAGSMGGGIAAAYQLTAQSGHYAQTLRTQEEGIFLTRKIAWALRGATNVQHTAHTLTVMRPDLGAESPLVFSVDQGMFFLVRAGAPRVALLGAGTRVTDVQFEVSSESPSLVMVSFTVNTVSFTVGTYLYE